MMRGSPALVIRPNVEALEKLEPGAFKCGLLNVLKKSPRTSTLRPSRSVKCFEMDQSRLTKPGPRRRLRGELPKVPGAFRVKAAVLNHALI